MPIGSAAALIFSIDTDEQSVTKGKAKLINEQA
jgi:hypothetical protein